MPEIGEKYVLDSYALLAYFQGESSGAFVIELVQAALNRKTILYLSIINAGEIYYITYKNLNKAKADGILRDIHRLPVELCSATDKLVMSSAEIKAIYPISYADSFVASLAQELNAPLVTGDPEFKLLEQDFDIVWI
jgi:ribonuclease VapC